MSWLQALLLPFVLFVPGYAIAAALFPPQTIQRSDRVVYSFVFGISAAGLGGLALQVFVGLGLGAWLGLLLAIALGAVAIARLRRHAPPIQAAPGLPLRLPAGPWWALGFLAAVAIGGVSVAIAVQGVRDQQSEQVFASLWAFPAKAPSPQAGQPRALTVGVWNHGGPATYRLRVSTPAGVLESMRVPIGSDERWQRTLPPPVSAATGSLLITLFHRSRPFRTVELNIGQGQ
jgi:hypothetical protein